VVRRTRQRTAILKALVEADRPLSPAELLAHAQRFAPRLGMATVYRNIRRLVDDGELAEVQLPGAPPRYEVARKDHHHHFHCRSCDRVFEVEGCPGPLAGLAPKGFSVEDHEIVLYGTCRDCA